MKLFPTGIALKEKDARGIGAAFDHLSRSTSYLKVLE
jgi:hypothetical protein